MNLFSELYSCYYQVVARILEEAGRGGISRRRMEELADAYGYQESGLTIVPALTTGEWAVLTPADSEGRYHSKLLHSPRMPLTRLQKSWLKALLAEPKIHLFLTADQKRQAETALQEVKPLYAPDDFLYFDQYADSDSPLSIMYQEHFRTILSAMRDREMVKLSYYSGKGTFFDRICLPMRLEYSPKDGKFRLYAVSRRKRGSGARADSRNWRTDILNLARILSVKPMGLVAETPPDLDLLLDRRERREPLQLEISDERNGLERTMLHFASYEKTVERLEEPGKYLCSIYYDGTWETELLIQVLSFGPVVRVLGPEYFLEQIRERIRQQPE